MSERTKPREAPAESRCYAHGCPAIGTEPIEVGFNELTPDGMTPRAEHIWVCRTHLHLVAEEILRAAE